MFWFTNLSTNNHQKQFFCSFLITSFHSNILIVFLRKVTVDTGGITSDSAEAVFKMPELFKIIEIGCSSYGPVIMVDGEVVSSSRDHSIVSHVVEVSLASVTIWLSKY